LKKQPTVLGEDLIVVASQLASFDKTRDRPDLLALDAAGKLVVVEIKRDESGSGQDLQALRYAAYVATMQTDQIVELFRSYRQQQHAETLTNDEARERNWSSSLELNRSKPWTKMKSLASSLSLANFGLG